MTTSLRDFVNIEGRNEIEIFYKPSKNGKVTAGMKHKETMEHALAMLQPRIVEYLDTEIKSQMEKCTTVKELTSVEVPTLPLTLRYEILAFVDNQRKMDIVEKAIFLNEMMLSAHTAVVQASRNMSMHYANMLGASGGHILGLNGKPMSN